MGLRQTASPGFVVDPRYIVEQEALKKKLEQAQAERKKEDSYLSSFLESTKNISKPNPLGISGAMSGTAEWLKNKDNFDALFEDMMPGGRARKAKRVADQEAEMQRSRQQLEASQKEAEYEKSLRQATGLERSQYEDEARRGLASNLAGVKRDASSRGLLFSGIKQAGDVASTNQAGAQMALGSAKAAQSYRDKLAQYRGETVNRGLDEYQLAQQKAAADYNQALSKRRQVQAENRGLSQTLGSIGSAAGTVAGALAPI